MSVPIHILITTLLPLKALIFCQVLESSFFNNLCFSQLPFLVQVSNRICIFLCSYTFPIESLFRTMFGIKFTAPSLRMRYLDIFQVLFHSQNTNQFFQFSQILLSFQTLGFLLKFLSFLSEF